MWVLDVINASTNAVETSFYLIAGEWSLGRKKCHFNFHADSSISRTHAVIRVGALAHEDLGVPETRPPLALVDQNSRFGSFVNQEQCFGERELKHGDLVTFGAKRTVLRVRYQPFVLVASRLLRAERRRVHDACQRMGMHLIHRENENATHCIILDTDRIVATVKILWALVFNQPVVTTAWLYAILARKSMSEPLPRCEDFLPRDESMPSVTSSYLPHPLRKTLFHRHAVVFLTPQSMEDLIAAMDGIVLAAYKDPEHDELLLRDLEHHAGSRHVLIVEPQQGSGFSSAAASSDAREPTVPTTGSLQASVERRVELFRSIGATFTTIQELAASVIFVKAPTPVHDCSFSSSLTGHNSMSAQIMSFPEHLSLKRRPEDEDEDDEDEQHGDDVNQQDPVPKREDPETSSHLHTGELMSPLQPPNPLSRHTGLRVPVPDDIVQDSVQVKEEPPTSTIIPSSLDSDSIKIESQSSAAIPSDTTAVDLASTDDRVPRQRRPESPVSVDETRNTMSSAQNAWVSMRSHRQRMQFRDTTTEGGDEFDAMRPQVASCPLVVKRPRAAHEPSSTTSAIPNFKRFKKGNGYSTPSRASLFPKPTVISVTVGNDEREAFQQNMEALEEQERIAEELFAMVENRPKKKRR